MARWFALALAAAALLASCSDAPQTTLGTRDSGPAGTPQCPAYKVSSKTSLTDPVVSMKSGVLPIIAQNCAQIKACHGAGTLHVPLSGDSSAVRTALVGVPSGELPRMPFVTASDPSQSYLLHKMDGDQCLFDKECGNGYCQDTMPSSAPLLPAEQRLVIRRWIAQGAKDN